MRHARWDSRVRRVAFIASLLALAACGDSGGDGDVSTECAGDHTGEWAGTTVMDFLALGANCSYAYDGVDGCESSGTYAAPLGDSGNVQVEIAASTGGECLPVGNYQCSYMFDMQAATLSIDCGAGSFEYSRP